MISFASILLVVGVATIAIVASVMVFMRPRRFYFVRHSETILNAAHIRQGADGALSPKGKQQAENVGRDLARLSIKRIISSTYQRARETTEIINAHLKVPVLYSDLLCERRNPSEIIGKTTDDPEVARIIDQIDLAYHDDDYRFSDEENFVDFKKRAKKCLTFLTHQRASETCIVTHHKFLKMMLSYMLYREKFSAADFAKLSFFNPSDNAGITVCEYHPWLSLSKTRGWEVVTYNEKP